jgi:MerR family transcriptional regulator, light-induced transcriptional regulator
LAIYSIKDLEKISGIKAHTLRIWEKRYGIITPMRTSTNIRYYQDDDLRRLLNISLLNRYGYKISKIACLDDNEIANIVSSISDKMNEHDTQMDALTISMIEMDENKFNRIITKNIKQSGFERTMTDIVYPFLDKLSILWFTGSVNTIQENFIANLIKQKIFVALDQLSINSSADAKSIFLYLPEGESQELSMLFLHYLLKTRGFFVINAGQSVSIKDLVQMKDNRSFDFIFTMFNEPRSRFNIKDYLDKVTVLFKHSKFLTTGFQIYEQNITSTENYTVFKSVHDVILYLEATLDKDIPGESK